MPNTVGCLDIGPLNELGLVHKITNVSEKNGLRKGNKMSKNGFIFVYGLFNTISCCYGQPISISLKYNLVFSNYLL